MVSIIVVNYKQIELTIELLNSIKDFCIYSNYEIIIVDNEADFENKNKLQNAINDIVYIPLSYNAGFAKANNIGANIAHGEFLLFINNDTTITSGLLKNLVETISSSEKIGIVCPIIKYYNEPDKIQYAGYTKINSITGRNKVITKCDSKHAYETEYAHGAAMLMRKKLFKSIGGFDESYFLYYEEIDLSAKVVNMGYTIYVNPNTFIYHKVSSSTGVDSPLKNYYLTRNRIVFMRNNFSKSNFYTYLLFHFTVSMPVNILKYLIKNKYNNLKKFILGTVDGLKNNIGFKALN